MYIEVRTSRALDKQASQIGLVQAMALALRDTGTAMRSALSPLPSALRTALTHFRALHASGHTSCSDTAAGVNGVAKHNMACRYCFSDEVRRSRSRWYDPVVRLVLRGRDPYRCLACRWRQWRRIA
jgi:hypothetical protein